MYVCKYKREINQYCLIRKTKQEKYSSGRRLLPKIQEHICFVLKVLLLAHRKWCVSFFVARNFDEVQQIYATTVATTTVSQRTKKKTKQISQTPGFKTIIFFCITNERKRFWDIDCVDDHDQDVIKRKTNKWNEEYV